MKTQHFSVILEGAQTLSNAVELGVTLLSETVGAELSEDVLNEIGREQLGLNLLAGMRLELARQSQA